MVFPPQGSGSGSGGGDAYFVGWFSDAAELATSYPVGDEGKYAKVVDTGTIWIWDTGTSNWIDSGVSAYSDGDMLKSVYDTNADGVVDDSTRLGGYTASAYVRTTRTINGEPLSSDVSLTTDDVPEGSTNLYHVQSDWDESDSGLPSFINNKPDLTAYTEKVPTAIEDNLASFNSTGGVQDSGYTIDDGQETSSVLWSADKIRDEIDDAIGQTIQLQGSWDADTNTPTLPPDPLVVGDAWYVSVGGSSTLGDISSWATGEMAVYGTDGWFKIGSSQTSTIWGNVSGDITNQLDLVSYISNSTVSNANTLDGHDSTYFATSGDVPTAGAGLSETSNEFNVNVDDTTIGINGSDQLYVKNAVSAAENIGSGEGQSYAGTSDNTLQFRSILSGDRITVVQSDDTITISSTGGVGTGNVVGPETSIYNNISVFASTSGDIIADSGYAIDDLVKAPPVSTLGNFVVFATIDGNAVYDSGYSPANIPTEIDDLTDIVITSLSNDDVLQYDSTLEVWTNTQLDYGNVYAPTNGSTSSAIPKFTGTSGQYLSNTDIVINSSNNMNLNQHTIFNGTIDGGNLDA